MQSWSVGGGKHINAKKVSSRVIFFLTLQILARKYIGRRRDKRALFASKVLNYYCAPCTAERTRMFHGHFADPACSDHEIETAVTFPVC